MLYTYYSTHRLSLPTHPTHFFFFFFFPFPPSASPSSPLSAASSLSLLEPSPVMKSVNFWISWYWSCIVL